jgi:insulysin
MTSLSADEQDPNAATLNYYQIGRRSKKNYAIMQLLQGLFNTRAYASLRTEKQLGYVVAAGFKPLGCIDGAVVLVEGSAVEPFVANALIEQFVTEFGNEVA